MNIWSWLTLVILSGAYLAGLLTLVWSAMRAPESYEDADGFHLGREPLPRTFAGGDPAEMEREHAA